VKQRDIPYAVALPSYRGTNARIHATTEEDHRFARIAHLLDNTVARRSTSTSTFILFCSASS
jgi:hypothetical protein